MRMMKMSKIDTVIDLVKSRVGKNQYTQSASRVKVFEGYSDCSSLMWQCYLKGANLYIGIWTGEQVDHGTLVKQNFGGRHTLTSADLKVMKPGDLVFWGRGHDDTRHVEMYIGNNQLIGHGSGVGPKYKVATDYYHTYPLVEIRRYINSDDTVDTKPRSFITTNTGICKGSGVNVRKTASKLGSVLGTLSLGDAVELDGTVKGKWVHVFAKGIGVGWVYKTYIEEASSSPASNSSKYKRKFVGRCTGDDVAIRTWAGTENAKIQSYGSLYKGNLVDVLNYDQVDKEGKIWYYIKVANSFYGFVRSDYIVKNS